jgi:hypothetical protein
MAYDVLQISAAVKVSLSFAQVMREIGKRGSGTQQRIKLFCQRNKIDYSHFTGQAHCTPQSKVSFENGSKKVSTNILKHRLFASGIEKVCQSCGLSEWRGLPAPLELHHKDGNRNNNHPSNLQILCPNCHAQTESYCKRKRRLTTACTGLAGFSASPSESTLEGFTGQVGLSQPTANQ